MSPENFLYHARPANMLGETLYPLNVLKAIDLELYERERGKYIGREVLLELHIPVIDVLWNDALHLSPIHPYHLAEAWRAVGLSSDTWEREFFAIPVERIDAGRSVWFASGVLSVNDLRRDVSPFDPIAYRELIEPPASYHEHLRRRSDEGRPPRPYAYVPHVLVAASVDVAGLRLVRADVPPN
jgi:hypothetical protein